MAIPIASRCFDCWRPLTSTGDLFDAYLQRRTQPSPGAVLDHNLQHAVLVDQGGRCQVNDSTYRFADVVLPGSVSRKWVEAHVVGESSLYVDAHVSRFNPFSFRLIFGDLVSMGLIRRLEIESLVVNGSEFVVRLRKTSESSLPERFDPAVRTRLAAQSIAFQARDQMGGVSLPLLQFPQGFFLSSQMPFELGGIPD